MSVLMDKNEVEIMKKVNDARGQGGEWPASFTYGIDSNQITLEVVTSQ